MNDKCAYGNNVMSNPALKRTRSGMPRMAVIAFSVMRGMPLRAAQLKR